MNNRKKKTTADIANDEVAELLQAAQEDIFLKMNVHSHMVHASSSQIIDPDLDQRFQALKSNQNPRKPKPKNPSINKQSGNHHGDDDDLLGRFEALKKSLPSYEKTHALSVGGGEEGEDEDEDEDEVEKVIRWAKDAARLDPSPTSDDDDDDDDDDEESEDNYDSEEEAVKKGKNGSKSKRK